jgi:hypothetical protein
MHIKISKDFDGGYEQHFIVAPDLAKEVAEWLQQPTPSLQRP